MMHDTEELLRRHAPHVPPAPDRTRTRAWATLAHAMQTEAPAPSRRLWRLAPAAVLAALVLAAVVGGLGPALTPDPAGTTPAGGLFGPQPAEAVVRAVEVDGYTEVHFLDPTADPERIHAELEALGIDLGVTFVPADPFSVGRLVYSSEDDGIELLGQTGSELDGGPIGIRVPEGWSGSAEMAIGRAAEDGETFQTGVPLNAERPGGPLHCTSVRGMSPTEAAEVVRGVGLQVEWRTTTDGHASAEEPPSDFVVHDAIWHAPDTVMLFAGAGPIDPLPDNLQALVDEDCDGGAG